MLLGNTSPANTPTGVNDLFIARTINSGKYYEAHTLLLRMPQDKVSTLFNMALCLIYAGEHGRALAKLDQALSLVQNIPASGPAGEDAVSAAIKARQAAGDTHTLPLDEEYARLFPQIVKESILRLKVDCYAATEQWDAVVRTATQLSGKDYANVERALARRP